MSCSSCGSCSPCHCVTCDASNEPLASALNNFIVAFFGTVEKTCVDGKVLWNLPCDLDAGIEGYPRLANEGIACYLLRIFQIAQNVCLPTGNIYYVMKKYSGAGAAIVTGLTYASITSTNAEYTAQLAAAVRGSTVCTYPDPWAARNAALDAIAAGTVENAEIQVIGGGSWTVGSDVPASNGDITGALPNSGVTADVGFSAANATLYASLIQNLIDYNFDPQTNITFINSAYVINLMYLVDATDAAFMSSIYGKGNFFQVYGEVNGFDACICTIDNARAIITFEAATVILQQSSGFRLPNFKTFISNIDILLAPNTRMLYPESTREGEGNTSLLAFNVTTIRWGEGQIPYPETLPLIPWYFTSTQFNGSERNKAWVLEIDSLYMVGHEQGALFYHGYDGSDKNLKMLTSIKAMHVTNSGAAHQANAEAGLIMFNPTGLRQNTKWIWNFGAVRSQIRLLGWAVLSDQAGCVNNRINIHCDEFERYYDPADPTLRAGIISCATFGGGVGEAGIITVSGNYHDIGSTNPIRAYDSSEKFIIEGTWINDQAGQPVLFIIADSQRRLVLKDAIFVNDGTVDTITTSFAGRIYSKNVHATAGVAGAITVDGVAVLVDADLVTYFP